MLLQRISLNNLKSSFITYVSQIVKNDYRNNFFRFQTQPRIKFLSTTQSLASQIGRKPITYPPEVTITHDQTPITKTQVQADLFSTTLTISGPLGTHSMPIKPYVKIIFHDKTNGKNLSVVVKDKNIKQQKQMWGTTRALITNYVIGVSEGYKVLLRFSGVGYRANMEDNKLVLRVGYAHPIIMDIPDGIECITPSPTKIILSGTDKQKVFQFAANIRKHRPPEPYNQKGIFVGDETIKKKLSKKK
ncbi:ribosomal protein L6, alpha-beta domain-containing protein [Glomus cerebriforme]|uniref:Ribosomal protein L6, alpha-beta domain-containing protein n=1 Tax=Glomus cerebriforme TaxID=658196 RepID=A0A397TBG9_9GLOM|nr:ribosomal protein L6, alpha-beta domain-containing protein [Glomus cerebriforme]